MSQPVIQADYEQLRGIAQRFQAQEQVCISLSQDLARHLADLEDGGWVGQGAAAFFSTMDESLMPAVQRLSNALQEARGITLRVIEAIRRAEEEAAGLFGQAGPPGLLSSVNDPPAPRIFIINGINSAGDVAGKRGDDDAIALEQLFESYGYDPDEVMSTSAIYTVAPPPSISGTNLSGTSFGGLGSPIDWLTRGVADKVNVVTGAGAEVFNRGAQFVGLAEGSIQGSAEVFQEYVQVDQGKYTRKIYDEISHDLRKNPLLPGQSIVLVGHSGGGAVAANLTGMLERKQGVDVSGLITAGSPVANYDEASRYAELILDVRHDDDSIAEQLFDRPTLRGGWLPWAPSGGQPGVEELHLTSPTKGTLDAHGSYFDPTDVASRDMMLRIRKLYPEMRLQASPQ